MFSSIRISEYITLLLRLFLVYFFYFIARCLFYFYNINLIEIDSIAEFFSLYYHGLVFDTAAILYVNGLFILFSIFPFLINTTVKYQRFLFYIYIIPNLAAFSLNFVDFIYYRFNFGRTTLAVMDSVKNESNKLYLFVNFLTRYWHVFLLFILASYIWILLYKKIQITSGQVFSNFKYFTSSVIMFFLVVTLAIGGIRGDFKKSTRPVNLVDANRYVRTVSQADFVLNTPFAFIRTLGIKSFKKVDLVSQTTIDNLVQPIKNYKNNEPTKPNIIILIWESCGREYLQSFNKNTTIKNYRGYTPFIDSLAQHSMVYANAHANGYKSIHAMSSILAGIPSFKEAFTSSPYAKQKTTSLIATLESIGYQTSFFHGAPNGSMGFLGYGKILGVDKYYGKAEYNNDADFDNVWGIWDEPFLQFANKEFGKQKQPFFSTIFTVTSHEPYQIPKKYKGKFPVGDINIHESIGYTDYALKQFFAAAKKQAWYQNTVFIIVGDHGNSIYYDEYKKEINKNAVALMLFSPDRKYVGYDAEYAQQIDIFPTILDIIGYQKPFRSWGRSLLSNDNISPFAVKWSGSYYEYLEGNYIVTFDGKNVLGFYNKNDKDLQNNLIAKKNNEMKSLELKVKAFIQNYMNSIIEKRL